jgi:ABC-2 type transport system permease protein
MNAFTGTGRLLRLALRRDRVVLCLWLLALAVFLLGTTHMSVVGLPTHREAVTKTRFMAANPGMRLMSLSSGASVGAYAMSRSYLTVAVLAAVMSVLCVVRHSRQNEETGRDELLRCGVVGPAAGVSAAALLAVGADLALAPLLGLAMIANGQPAAGSFAAGAAVAAVGIVFAGVAALAAQLSASARGANGLGLAGVAVAFALAGVGGMLGRTDASGLVAYGAWPIWLSPLGWGFELRPFGGDHWWVLALPAACAAVFIAVAVGCAARRDLGRGLLAERAGRATASPRLRGTFGLAFRLQRNAFVAWLVTAVGFGLIFGSVSGSARTMTGAMRDWYLRMGGTDHLLDAFFTSMIELAAMLAAISAVQVLLRLREEESRGRLEPLLAAAVSRPRWAASQLAVAALGAVAVLIGFAVAMALAAGAVVGDTPHLLAELTGAALLQLPAVLAVAGAVVAVFALWPRRAVVVSWLLVGAAILASPVFGASLRLPRWVVELSPFAHQKAPAASVGVAALVVLLGLAALAAAGGLAAFRRRDLAAG